MAARGEEQLGLGFATAEVYVLAALLVVDTAKVEGAEIVEVDKRPVLDLIDVADLGLFEVTVIAEIVDVDVTEGSSLEPLSLAEVVAAAPSSATEVVAAEPSSPVEVLAAEPSSPAEVAAGALLSPPSEPESDPSLPELAPESSPEPGSEVGVALRVEDEDFFTVIPLTKVPVTELDTFVPLLEAEITLVLLFEALDTLVLLLEALEAGKVFVDDFVELLRDTPLLTPVADEVFAVSLLQAIPIQRLVDELGTGVDVVGFVVVFNEIGLSVRWLHG